MSRQFDTHVVVDWSARSNPSPARPASDAIWWAVAREGGVEPPEYARTRAEAVARLRTLLAAEVWAGRRVLIGFDFPFGYPEGVARHLTGQPHAYALWDWIAERVGDGPDNRNRRFEVAEEINAAYDGVGPMWGRPRTWPNPGVPVTMKERRGVAHPPERRRADARSSTAKTVWQLAYAGSVGSQVLVGLPALKALREAPELRDHLSVWPFDTGLQVPQTAICVAEIYPSLLQREVRTRKRPYEVLDAAQVRVLAGAFAGLDRQSGLTPLFEGPRDLSDKDRRVICTEEAWILGLGGEDALCAAIDRPAGWIRDPKAIYDESFRIVRQEADLEHLPDDLAEVAIRVIHACGTVDIAGRLAFSPHVVNAARDALSKGAPIVCDCQMVASGIIRRALPPDVEVLTAIADDRTAELAAARATTRSAAGMEVLRERLDGAVVTIGNAPTALFRLLEFIEEGLRPAAILAFPVGFVGAAESKAQLAGAAHDVPFLTLPGRRGGSAMASAAVNGITLGLRGDGT